MRKIMSYYSSGKYALTSLFDQFYTIVLTVKRDIDARKFEEIDHAFIQQSQQKLKNFFSDQYIVLNKENSFINAELQEVSYLMAALADDIFLSFDWPGREYWKNNLLETELFGTHIAGDAVFTKIDEFLKNSNYLNTDIGIIFFKVLALGFQGRYYPGDSNAELLGYKKRLYKFLIHADSSFRVTKNLCPNNYSFIPSNVKPVKLPDPKWWGYGLAAIGLIFLVISTTIWCDLTSAIKREVGKIQQLIIKDK